ncbi:PREDICTED: UPF0505 protein isoform X2 [Nelumbo nucifera]|uniref:UPF0505 protein isoform X2 n=2 Tax=Nelumbo nucifera TaxID=4432 RepID=A0A1U7Z1I7_NELNU|nr:PREDICTED: UPF0505 protein isoform X2 [Nelumbo nucifera]DAD20427.1 TPA_asm: hypothetical protein HUJ06_021890 [Nelumbo nucifera]
MEFRERDYGAEESAYSLPRVPAKNHPLFARSLPYQVDVTDNGKDDFCDPLRGLGANMAMHIGDVEDVQSTYNRKLSNEAALQLSEKEWASFKRSLMQKFSATKTVSISSMSDVIVKSGKAHDKSSTSMHLEELDDPQKIAEEDVKVITCQEYVSRLHELKDEICHAWQADDRVTSLKLSIKVARLLMDTSVLQFYPTLFVLVTDVMDMLGDLVWERIKRRAKYADDGTIICSLPENFKAIDVCPDAKETCNNWFCKIGSISELLPRIYSELAILHCWRFLHDQPCESLQRLVMMMRGLADPLASVYCHLYLVRCAQKLLPCDRGYLITCINDISIILMRIISGKETISRYSSGNKKLLISLIEPTIEWSVKCMFTYQWEIGNLFAELGLGGNLSESSQNPPCISIVLHHIIKELPAEIVSSDALEIVQLIESSKDFSFDQHLNYTLLGFKLCERRPQMDSVDAVLVKVFQAVSQYDSLDEYLKVVDAYLDIVLQYQMENYLTIILDGISKRASDKVVAESELGSLQSIFIKLLTHFNDLEDAFALNHFVEILDVMYGTSRNTVNMHILNKATRNGYIRDPTTIQLLFEISQALHDGIDFSSIKDDDNQQSARLISHFIQMVDYGTEMDRHLTFLVECRGAFGSINELKGTLVHSSNSLAIKAMKGTNKHVSFVKSCIAFSEVTIPSISAGIRQMNLYLETAEVALLGGLVSHTDGLIESAISSLQSLDITRGSQINVDVDGIISSIRKLCSLLIMVPGNPTEGIFYIPKSLLSLVTSDPGVTPRLRARTLCAIISLSATFSQNTLPYHVKNTEVMGNDILFFGDPSYNQELSSISSISVQNLVEGIQEEAARGTMALEACNCIISSFKANPEISLICSRLMEIAKSCLNANDKYLRSTLNILDKHLACSRDACVVVV